MKRLAIVNTIRYRAKRKSFTESIIDRIKEELGADLVFTEYQGHAEEIAKDSPDYDTIIAVGGDGTIFEVVNGMNLETQALAIMPFGAGNSLALDLDIASIPKAFEVIRKKKPIKIDLIECQFKINSKKIKRYNVVTSGLGFASATANFANRYLKKTGSNCYTLSGCVKAFSQKVISAKIQLDNSSCEDVEFTNLLVNNSRYAGNTCIFPKADLRDSRFNILCAKTNVLIQHLWNIGIITRTYFYYPDSKTANRLSIILHKPSSFMLDGEIFDYVKEIEYSVIPQRLQILT